MKDIFELIQLVKGFGMNCFFWSLYQSNETRAILFLELASELDEWCYSVVNVMQGRLGSRVNFVGSRFVVLKFDVGHYDRLTSQVDLVYREVEGADMVRLLGDLSVLLHKYRGLLFRSGKLSM